MWDTTISQKVIEFTLKMNSHNHGFNEFIVNNGFNESVMFGSATVDEQVIQTQELLKIDRNISFGGGSGQQNPLNPAYDKDVSNCPDPDGEGREGIDVISGHSDAEDLGIGVSSKEDIPPIENAEVARINIDGDDEQSHKTCLLQMKNLQPTNCVTSMVKTEKRSSRVRTPMTLTLVVTALAASFPETYRQSLGFCCGSPSD